MLNARSLTAVILFVVATAAVVGWSRAEDTRSSELSDRVAQLESELAHDQYVETARRGAKVFARACAACHGTGGKGDGPGAADLDPPPRDLTTRQFRFHIATLLSSEYLGPLSPKRFGLMSA